jgi:tetratricopeptide (TPR) repeat protein
MHTYIHTQFENLVRPFLIQRDGHGLIEALNRRYASAELADFLTHGRSDTVKLALFCLSLVGRLSEYDKVAALLHHPDPFVVSLVEFTLCEMAFKDGGHDHAPMLRRATLLARDDHLDHALLLLNRIVVERPGFAEAYYQRALVHDTRGDYSASLDDCRHALELNPRHYGAHAHMGNACAQLDDFDQALACYYAALDIHPRIEGLHETISCVRRILARRDPGHERGRTPH